MNKTKLLKQIYFFIHKQKNPILWTKTSEAFYDVIKQHCSINESMLEIGSGTGHISYQLAKDGFKVTLNEIRKESLDYSKKIFEGNNLKSSYIYGNFFSIKKTFDFSWNSGLIQCLPDAQKNVFVKKLTKVSPKVVLFYPDINDQNKIKGNNSKKIPGVDDAKEYKIENIPKILHKYFDIVHVGTLSAKQVGLPYSMYWIYGENKW